MCRHCFRYKRVWRAAVDHVPCCQVSASLARIGAQRSHRLSVSRYLQTPERHVLFCTLCGYWCERAARCLAEPCAVAGGKPRTRAGEQNLRRLLKGQHPSGSGRLGEPWALPRPPETTATPAAEARRAELARWELQEEELRRQGAEPRPPSPPATAAAAFRTLRPPRGRPCGTFCSGPAHSCSAAQAPPPKPPEPAGERGATACPGGTVWRRVCHKRPPDFVPADVDAAREQVCR